MRLALAACTLILIVGLIYGVGFYRQEAERYRLAAEEAGRQVKVAEYEKVSAEFDQPQAKQPDARVKEDPHTLLLAQELEAARRELSSLRDAYSRIIFEKQLSDLTKMPEGLDQFYADIRATGLLKEDKEYGNWMCRSANEAWLAVHDIGEAEWPTQSRLYAEKYNETPNLRAAAFLDAVDLWVYNDRFRQNGTYPEIKSEERAKAIYAFVSSKVRYASEVADYPRFPVETMSYGSGDCEDLAILLAALLERAGYQTALLTIVDEQQGLYHAATLLKPEAGWRAGNWPIGEEKWILLDPSFKNGWGQDPIWAGQYRKNGEVNIPVYSSVSFELAYKGVNEAKERYCAGQ